MAEDKETQRELSVTGIEVGGAQQVKPFTLEQLIQYAEALDAAQHGGMHRNHFGKRYVDFHRNPFTDIEAFREKARRLREQTTKNGGIKTYG